MATAHEQQLAKDLVVVLSELTPLGFPRDRL
jgi:hypothetical protein